MAKRRPGAKAERALTFLQGLSNPGVVRALSAHGFSDRDRDEGWAHLRALGDVLSLPQPAPTDRSRLHALDAWQNRWFPVASACLGRRFPAVHDWLFLNLSQQRGELVAVAVQVFIERLERLHEIDGGAPARELLTTRGLDAARVQEGKALLTELWRLPAARPPLADRTQRDSAADALWAWYLEWSRLARVAIKDRQLLRELGFLKS